MDFSRSFGQAMHKRCSRSKNRKRAPPKHHRLRSADLQWISNCCLTNACTLMILSPSGGLSSVMPRKIKLATVKCGDEMCKAIGPMSRSSCLTSISRPVAPSTITRSAFQGSPTGREREWRRTRWKVTRGGGIGNEPDRLRRTRNVAERAVAVQNCFHYMQRRETGVRDGLVFKRRSRLQRRRAGASGRHDNNDSPLCRIVPKSERSVTAVADGRMKEKSQLRTNSGQRRGTFQRFSPRQFTRGRP